MTHICANKLTTISSENGLAPGRHQFIIWTNARISLIGPLETNFSDTFIEILTFSFKKMRFKMSSRKWRPFCLAPNALPSGSRKLIRTETHHPVFSYREPGKWFSGRHLVGEQRFLTSGEALVVITRMTPVFALFTPHHLGSTNLPKSQPCGRRSPW